MWATPEANGTTWHAYGIAMLRDMLNHMDIKLEYVQHFENSMTLTLEGTGSLYI